MTTIYKQYSQEQLDLQYNNRYHVPDFETSLSGWETLSRSTEEKYRVLKDIPYGILPRETLDVFPSPHLHSRTLVFIHGGYWQMFDKSSFHFIGGAFARYRITTVIINYPLAPAYSMDQIVTSCRKAIYWLSNNLAQLNGDPEQIYIAGHSAGGHLAALLMTADGIRRNQNLIKGICSISGIFNLIPIQLSRINGMLQMDHAMATRNSPVLLPPVESCPLTIVVGQAETDEFKSQSMELYKAWKNKINAIELLEIPALNHFTILGSIQDMDSELHRAICKLMNL